MEGQSNILDISWETITKMAIAALFFYLLFLVRDIVIWFFFALIISVLFEPAINFLRWLRVPKLLAVTFIYLLFFGILGMFFYLTAPIFIDEIKQFSQSVPSYFEKVSPIFKDLKIEALQNLEYLTQDIASNLEAVSVSVFNALAAFFGGVASAFFIIVISFFISIEERGIERVLRLLSPKKNEDYILALFERCQSKVSGWFGARILACIFVSITCFLVFYFLGVKYAVILALLCGLLNFIPYIGPLVAGALLLVFVGIANSWTLASIALITFVVVNMIENNIISPILTKKFVGLPPVLVLLSVVVGGIIFGFLGAIFAIPVFGILYEFVREFLEKRKEDEEARQLT